MVTIKLIMSYCLFIYAFTLISTQLANSKMPSFHVEVDREDNNFGGYYCVKLELDRYENLLEFPSASAPTHSIGKIHPFP